MTVMRKAAVVSAVIFAAMLLSAARRPTESGVVPAFGAGVSGLAIELGRDFGAKAIATYRRQARAFAPQLLPYPDQAAVCPSTVSGLADPPGSWPRAGGFA